MDIYLMGYMGSGKTTVGALLSSHLNYNFIDFDDYITQREGRSISEIFEAKGEIYFRKKEAFYLNELLNTETEGAKVIALGGGTPCYGTNLQQIKDRDVVTVYLNIGVKLLTKRLWNEREGRPVISGQTSYEALEEFVRKHLFERGFYYNQASQVVKIVDQDPETIAQEIKALL